MNVEGIWGNCHITLERLEKITKSFVNIQRVPKKMYTHFKKGKMVLRFSNDDNRASATFFDCPACRTVTLAFIATVIQFNFEK